MMEEIKKFEFFKNLADEFNCSSEYFEIKDNLTKTIYKDCILVLEYISKYFIFYIKQKAKNKYETKSSAFIKDCNLKSDGIIYSIKAKGVDLTFKRKFVLKSCPFCGSKAEFITRESNHDYGLDINYDIKCTNPDCYLEDGSGSYYDNKKEVLDLWNSREKVNENI